MHAVFNVRSEPTAEAWLAAILARSRFGMAIAAIIRMIATTIKSSISENPFCLFRIVCFSRKMPEWAAGRVLSAGTSFESRPSIAQLDFGVFKMPIQS